MISHFIDMYSYIPCVQEMHTITNIQKQTSREALLVASTSVSIKVTNQQQKKRLQPTLILSPNMKMDIIWVECHLNEFQ